MKKLSLIILITTSLILSPLGFCCDSGDPIKINVASAGSKYNRAGISSAVIKNKTGKFIKGRKSNKKRPLASLTKLMTALVLLDEGINFNKKVTITKKDLNHVRKYVSGGASRVGLRAGDKVKVKDLWNAMLIASCNDSAAALVRGSGLSMKQFKKKMNAKAKSLGLKKTKFTECSGIDVKNVGTAREMAVIAREAFAKKKIRKASRRKSYRINILNSRRSITVKNRNGSLLKMKPSGFKIGYLTEARNNVAIYLKGKKKKKGIIVVLHAKTTYDRNKEIKKLKKKL